MWYFNDVFRYVLKAEFVTLVSIKVPSGPKQIVSSVVRFSRGSNAKSWYQKMPNLEFYLLSPETLSAKQQKQ